MATTTADLRWGDLEQRTRHYDPTSLPDQLGHNWSAGCDRTRSRTQVFACNSGAIILRRSCAQEATNEFHGRRYGLADLNLENCNANAESSNMVAKKICCRWSSDHDGLLNATPPTVVPTAKGNIRKSIVNSKSSVIVGGATRLSQCMNSGLFFV
jgi:hypothetical protein